MINIFCSIICRVMSTGKAQTEIACTVSWFSNWSHEQRQQFANTLSDIFHELCLEEHVSLDSLTSQLNDISLNKQNKESPSVFDCQLKIFNKWYSSWDHNAKIEFWDKLKSSYPDFASLLEKECNGMVFN